MSYFEHFTRPDQHYSTTSYENRLVASAKESEHNESSKYQNLFSDAFGHHVQFNLDVPAVIKLQLDNTRRFITNDSLTSYFLDVLYKPPKIYLSQNTQPKEADSRSFAYFVSSISDSPRTRTSPDGDTEGSNSLSFLVGDIGTGKTLLLCKAVREIKRAERLRSADAPTDQLLLPVYFDFETEMKGDGGQLLNIDDEFYGRLAHAIVRGVEQTEYARTRAAHMRDLDASVHPSKLARLIAIVRTLHTQGVRLLLVLDNLDGYHYHYSKYAFFAEYHRQQIDSIQRNITGLTTALSHGEQLGMLGLSVVLAARRYVYQDCLHTRAPEASAEFTGAVFQLHDADEGEIVTARLTLFEAAIRVIESNSRLRSFGEDYKKTLGRLRVLFGIQEATQGDAAKPIAAGAMRTLRLLCHHGNRGLVAFLSNLRLDHRDEAELIERFFWDKPHTLLLLYMADLCERYTQRHGHFPNLFLVDSQVLRDPDFPKAHLPHCHTYWLKYLVLAYVATHPDGIANTNQLRRLFVRSGQPEGYEDELVRLVLGSLSTSRESRCLEPEPGEKTIASRVAATARGSYLVSRWESYRTPFCFSFTYLQLVVDDYLMSYPKCIWEQIYAKDANLEYLFADAATYGLTNRAYLLKKMRCVLALVYLFRVSLELERQRHARVFTELARLSGAIVPNMDLVEADLFEQFRRILSSIKDSKAIFDDLSSYNNDLKKDSSGLRRALETYFKSPANVEE